jgi:hypothetical protein
MGTGDAVTVVSLSDRANLRPVSRRREEARGAECRAAPSRRPGNPSMRTEPRHPEPIERLAGPGGY